MSGESVEREGMFHKERKEEFTQEEMATTIKVLRSYAAETIRGNPKALPLELRQTI